MKKLSAFFLLLFLLSSCANHGQLTFITKLPKGKKENSGLESFEKNTVWGIEDSGNGDDIYKIDFQGKILKEFKVKNGKNRDWEDLARDSEGNLYIGDFGNNRNKRKDLVIYKLPNPETEPGDKIDAEKIEFNYPEQKDFPPKKKNRTFDAEAFFHYNDQLYIFTKNRADPFTGETWLYTVPDEKGEYQASFEGKLEICSDWKTCQVTSADISEDGKKIVLLGYGKLWILTNFSSDDILNGNMQEIDLGVRTQLESVCFIDKNTLLLSDEQTGPEGRNLYSYQIK